MRTIFKLFIIVGALYAFSLTPVYKKSVGVWLQKFETFCASLLESDKKPTAKGTGSVRSYAQSTSSPSTHYSAPSYSMPSVSASSEPSGFQDTKTIKDYNKPNDFGLPQGSSYGSRSY